MEVGSQCVLSWERHWGLRMFQCPRSIAVSCTVQLCISTHGASERLQEWCWLSIFKCPTRMVLLLWICITWCNCCPWWMVLGICLFNWFKSVPNIQQWWQNMYGSWCHCWGWIKSAKRALPHLVLLRTGCNGSGQDAWPLCMGRESGRYHFSQAN